MVTQRKPVAKRAVRRTAFKPAVARTAAGKPAEKKPIASRPRAAKPASRKRGKPAAPGILRKASGEVLRVAGIGTDAVAKATGKAWDQWLAVLDRAGALAMPHKAIAALLAGKHGVPSWWSQMIAVGYEQARGLREPHQKRDGFSASASRTVSASVERLFGAWQDPKLRALWLGQAPVTVKRSVDGKSIRMAWESGESGVEVNFRPAGEGRSRVQVQHDRLANRKTREARKSYWRDALDRLKAMLEKAA